MASCFLEFMLAFFVSLALLSGSSACEEADCIQSSAVGSVWTNLSLSKELLAKRKRHMTVFVEFYGSILGGDYGVFYHNRRRL